MSHITIVLDACSIIHLIHMDDDSEFLIKRLKHLDVNICEKVLKEVRANAFTIPEEYKRVDLAISKFLRHIVTDANISRDMGSGFENEVRKLSHYKKSNGEFFSTALGLYISQTKPTKLFFITDDYVAKHDFAYFYDLHQIGSINDTVDLLLLLYRLDDKFTKSELIRLLSSLFSKYTTEITELTSKLRKFRVPKGLLKDTQFNQNRIKLILSLEDFSLKDINDFRNFFLTNKKGLYRGIINIINQHETVFEWEFHSSE